MRRPNIYVITVPEQMNGGEAGFKELRIFQRTDGRHNYSDSNKMYCKQE